MIFGENLSEPLVLVPGHMCGAWLYAPQLAMVPDAILADVTSDDSTGAMADRLLATAPPRFHIAGLSMGAMVAMEVMARAADRVISACLMATDPGAARQQEVDWRAGLWAKGFEGYLDTFTSRFFMHNADTAARLGPMTRAEMGKTPEAIARAQATALDTRRDMIPLLAGCPVPTEILVGAEDRVCPPKIHQPLASAFRNAKLSVVPDCGHILTLDQPTPATEALQRLRTGSHG